MSKSLNIYNATYGMPLSEIKEFIEEAEKNGDNTIDLEIEWGYYDDIDALYLTSRKK